MGNEGDTHVRERSHLQGPQLLAHSSSLPPSSCLWVFLFNTIACSPTLAPQPTLDVCLSVCLFIYISICLCQSIFTYNLYVRPNQMDLPRHKRFIFPLKCKGDMQLIVRNSFCCASGHLLLPPVAGACRARAGVMDFYQ